MSEPLRIVGIVPAAGRSQRMGAAKPLLAVGGRPMLIGVVEALLEGGVSEVIVVASPRLRRELPAMSPCVRVALNDRQDSAMIESVRIALRHAIAADGCLVCPCDAAGIAAEDVRRCVQAFEQTPERVIIATHGGRQGHPVIFPASLAPVVQSGECNAGLNQLARNRPDLVRRVECASPGTIANVNTPQDYQRLGGEKPSSR